MSSAVVASYPPSRRQPARGGVSRTALGIVGVFVALVAALLVCVTPAQAATDYTKYLVGDTVSPTGTTINLFDYWVAGATNDNSANTNRYGANDDTGINAGHSLKFNGGESATSINKWTGSATPRNFVSKTLANGYPQISSGSESLAYLFDTSSQTGKASYYNVMGLLRSQDGYFCYDSTQNFASYDKQTNSFDVYNTWGVKEGGAGGDINGQFFPFNSASDVFSVMPWGSLTQQDINCDANSTLNHHFGLTMETQFTQPGDGQVVYNGQAQDMTYEFAGDDDVWVYIDGVLVGDLGGIHDRATLNINFHTGDVQVNDSSVGSLKSLYSAAGREGATSWDGNTYKASTRHTLKFFYLERGAYASNMKLKFNLSEQPVSEVKKADQNGNPVAGAQFKLFSANENYSYTENDLLATGTTSDTGTMQLIKSDGSPISFDDEYTINHRGHYVLREVTPPVGYRTSLTAGDKELHLDYVKTKDTDAAVTGGALVSPNQGVDSEDYPIKDADDNSITVNRQWINGGYATASETITAKYDLSKITDHNGKSLDSGLTFAVVLRNGNAGSAEDVNKDTNWFAVKGNGLYGYSLCEDHSVAGAVEAAHDAEKNGYSTVFTPSSTGFYEATLSYLPGDISKYAFMMTREDAAAGKAQYTVAVYHTTASSLGDATVDNTARVESSNFSRKFSSRLNLTNVQNRLWVQKVDDAGVPVAGAQFELYEAKDVTVGEDGSYTINEGAQPYDTATTKEETIYYGLKGGVAFPQGSDQHKPLVRGVYYLRESKAPDGYTRNETITKVYVDDSGVYVDAGKADDGVRSMSGPGSLLSLLSQFGRTTGLDDTLVYVKGTLQSATTDGDGNLDWNRDVSHSEGITSNTPMTDGWMDMKYGGTLVDGKPVLKYVTDDDSGSLPIIYADTGINRMRLIQNGSKTTNGDDLGNLQINQLFTQASGVEYTDVRVASLEVTKQVTADDGLTAPDAAFSFRFELPESDAGYDACVFNADGSVAGTTFKLKNGDVHSITAGQTIRVFGLSAGDYYKVEEVTTQAQASEGDLLATLGTFLTQSGQKSALSNGFSLVRRVKAGEQVEGQGNSIEGLVAAPSGDQTPDANKLVFVNSYSVTSTTLPASEGFWAKKVLSGRDWSDGDSFTLRLQAADGAPMPEGAQTDGSGAAYVDVTVRKANKDANVSFGDITYAAPGTYAYSIYELADQQDGMSFSAASYEVKVTVEDQHDGTLKVTGVSMARKTDDAGAKVPDVNANVADKVAAFTNTYNDYKSSVSFVANKAYTDGTGTNPLTEGMFSFKLEAVGGYASDTAPFDPKTVDKTIEAPMPEDAADRTSIATNDASGNVKFLSISLTAAKDAGKTYVYRLAEVDAGQPGYTYDGTKYYVVVRNHWNGNGIDVEYLYNKVLPDGSVVALGRGTVPTFSNSYDATPVEAAPIAGHKTLSGRDWKTSGETFSFVYSVADTATEEAVRNGSVVLPASTEGEAKGVKGDAETKNIDFGQTGITFKRPGTYTFAVSEKFASSESAGLRYDRHASKVTYVVSDLDAEGNHTGKLSVVSVTYDNSSATTESDRIYKDGVAFTNTYHAETTFAGVDLTKTMRGRALGEGDYKFQVSGLAYNGNQTSVEQAESLVTNPAADENQTAHVTVNGGKILSRTLTERDLGRVYAYRIHEVNDGDGNGYRYDTLNSGDAVVLVEAYLDYSAGSDLSKLNYLVTVLKGQKVIDVLNENGGDANVFTGEKIGELIEAAKTDSGLYAVQYDSAKAADAATTPTVAFVNEYTSSLDYKAAGGLTLTKTLESAGGTGEPGQNFEFDLVPQDTEGSTTAQQAADKLGIEVDGETFSTGNMGYGSKTIDLLPRGLTFTQADAGKTYTYAIKEVAGTAAGYTYDGATYTVAISVRDNDDGTMTASTTVSKTNADGTTEQLRTYVSGQGDTPNVPITNTYTVTVGDEAAFTPAAAKLVTGKDATETFTFELSCEDGPTQDAIDDGTITGSGLTKDNEYATTASTSGEIKNGTTQTVSFSQMTFNKVGTYHFKLREVGEAAADSEWRYDTHVHSVDVTVTDQGGKLVATHTDTSGNTNVFTNSYSTSTSYGATGGLDIVKTLSGRDLRAGDFTFTVEATNDDAKAKLGKDSLEVANGALDADGTATVTPLDGLTFSTEDLGKSFEFKVSEKNDGKPGYSYDDSYYLVTITPEAGDHGATIHTVTTVAKFDAKGDQQGAAETFTGTADSPVTARVTFANSYNATGELGGEGSASIQAYKTLTGSAATEGTYHFTAYAINGDGSKATAMKTAEVSAKPGEKTKIDFGSIKLTTTGDSSEVKDAVSLASLVEKGLATKTTNADGTYDYALRVRVSEDVSSLPDGVRPSATDPSYVVTVNVHDDGQGNLTSTVSYPTTSNELNFINTQDKVKTIGTADKPTVDIDGQVLSVGAEYVYTINWVNNAADENGNLTAADVTVVDTLPAGLALVEDGTTSGYTWNDDNTLVWELGQQEANASGSISIRVRVTEDAVVRDGESMGTIENTATVKVGENRSYTGTTTNYVPKKKVDGLFDLDGNLASLGKELTYTVSYMNATDQTADVYVFDTVPSGTDFVSYDNQGRDDITFTRDGQDGTNLTWKIKDVAAGTQGTVSFKVKVNESAFRTDHPITNQATMRIGENDPSYMTNKTEVDVNSGSLYIMKSVEAVDGLTAPNKKFKFKIELFAQDGSPLTGQYPYSIEAADGTHAEGYFTSWTDGQTDEYFELGGGDLLRFDSLPSDSHYTVTEVDANKEGFSASVSDGWEDPVPGDTSEGSISRFVPGLAIFTNTYGVTSTELDGAAAFRVKKVLDGRDWTDDAFTFELTAEDNAPLPADTELTLTKDAQTGNFGNVTYTTPGTYTYYITEKDTGADSMIFSRARYRVTVTVTDNGDGTLSVAHSMVRVQGDKGEAFNAMAAPDGTATFTNNGVTAKTIGTVDNPTVNIDGQLLSVGDEYTYSIAWTNNNATAAGVSIEDALPVGTEFVSATDGGAYTPEDGTVRWDLGQQAALTMGAVRVTVRITEDAVSADALSNSATITVGNHTSKTNTTVNDVPKKSVADAAGNDANGQPVKVGDSLTYSVTVSNKTASEASYVITDPVDSGLTVTDVSDHGTYDLGSRTITWPEFTLAPGESRTVTFAATVNSAAATKDAVTNQASVKVGNNPEVKTNVVTITVPSAGKLTVSKTVEGHAADKSFDFTVALTGTDGKPVSGTFGTGSAAVTFDESGMATFKLKGGESKTISGLPEGATYEVTEAAASGYDPTFEGEKGTVTKEGATAAFINTYGIITPATVNTDALFGKRLVGRDWKAGDSFTFSIAADAASAANTPMPANTTTTVASATAKDGDIVRFGFGSITFDAAGTYIYDVSETGDDANGIKLDRNVAKLTIHVTDNGDGTLSVSKSSVVVENGIFTNTYTSELDYNAAGGVWLTKTLNGRAMTDGQFTFVLVAQDKASADRLGIDLNQGQTLSAPAAAAGKASAEVDVLAGHSLTFTQADAGKTYSYRLTEVVPDEVPAGYSYDSDSRDITIKVVDNGDGTLTAKTTVTGGEQERSAECTSGQPGTSRLVIPFVNSYTATGELGGSGSARIEATKELTGRKLEAEEFKFKVVETVDGGEKVVSWGTNDAEGNITFDAISYTQDEVGEHQYVVREVTDGLPAGVTGVATEFPITVTVTDNGAGTLSTSVGYPKDTSSLTFKNAYGSGSTVEVPMAGSKAYETPQGEGYNAPSIDGKFEFTLTGKDGALMPAGSKNGTKVVKNVNGSVDFGSISYQMSDVNGAPGRSKTFTYTVAETGGEVAGVTPDTAEKTVKVTVRDNGNGTLSATVADGAGQPIEQGALKFGFTNAYKVKTVESSVTDEGGVGVTKELTGRKLEAGEFTFDLVETVDGEDKVVSQATNDANGKVAFDPIAYTEPGIHNYRLVEEQGVAGGVTFDRTEHTVRVTVSDNGEGQLVAKTELLDATGSVAKDASVRFNNSYVPAEGSARIVATKVLSGTTLTEGQFAFELTDADGNVLQTAKNAADGSVTFDELTYGAADAGKTYVYHVREVNDGQANVTYDSTVRSFSVTVADDGQGHIVATVSGADDLTFTNAYNEPSTPDQPDKPGTPSDAPEGPGGEQVPELPNTGDQSASLPLLGGLAGVGVAALLAALVVRRRRS